MKAGYVDGFVLIVPKKNVVAYRKMATFGKKLWMKYGALDYKECIGDDLRAKMGKDEAPMTFLSALKAKPTDTVWFSFITFKSKKHRDQVNARVMKDPAMNEKNWDEPMPMDMKKFLYGGFKTIVDA